MSTQFQSLQKTKEKNIQDEMELFIKKLKEHVMACQDPQNCHAMKLFFMATDDD